MKNPMKGLALCTLVTFLGLGVAPAAPAQINTEKSLFTLAEPMDVGGFVLDPGTYRIKVVEMNSNRNVVQVTNEAGSRVFATVLATPHVIQTDETIPESRFAYFPAISGQPKALRTWFARDTPYGQDIIYRKRRAMELAAVAKAPVIAIPDETKEAEYATTALAVVTPEQQVKPYEEPPPTRIAEARPAALPATASNLPILALFGFLFLGGAISVRMFARKPA
jgi:hypothetical protein